MTLSDVVSFARKRKGTVASVALHLLVVGWGLFSFSARSVPIPPPEDLVPVDIISDGPVTSKQGHKDGKKENPKPLVDKVGDIKPAEDIVGKVNPKQVTETDSAPAPQPKPEKPVEKKPDPPKPVEKQPDPPKPVVEKKPDPPKPVAAQDKPKPEEKKPDAFNPDQIASMLNKDKAKQPPKPQQAAAAPEPPKHKSERKFDMEKIAEAINQKDPTRQAAAGAELNANASLGKPQGKDVANVASWQYAFQEAVGRCFSTPFSGVDESKIEVDVDIQMRPDGSLAAAPSVVAMRGPSQAINLAMAESARRAIQNCQPYSFLPKNQYADWKLIPTTFNLKMMNSMRGRT
jgi:outer membrane biosynthesis protein TonB